MADVATRQRWRYAKNIIEGNSSLIDGPHLGDLSFIESKAKKNLFARLADIELRAQRGVSIPEKELHEAFTWGGTHLYASPEDEFFLVRKLVSIPFKVFTPKVIEFGISTWVWISRARPTVHSRVFAEITKNWEWSLQYQKGLFSLAFKFSPSF